MAGEPEEGPDLFEDIGEGVGGGSGEGTAQPGGDPGEPAEDDGAAAPGGDAPIASSPSSSMVGLRDAGDTADIGSTEGMRASTGGLAGTSR